MTWTPSESEVASSKSTPLGSNERLISLKVWLSSDLRSPTTPQVGHNSLFWSFLPQRFSTQAVGEGFGRGGKKPKVWAGVQKDAPGMGRSRGSAHFVGFHI